MSASPSGLSPLGRPGRTPNGAGPGINRPRPKANPLVAARKPARKPPTALKPGVPNAGGRLAPSQTSAGRPAMTGPRPGVASSASPLTTAPPPEDPPGQMQEYPLYTTRRALLEGSRHHILRFTSKDRVDILNQDQFERPVLLHRRDPRAPPAGSEHGAMDIDVKEDLAALEEKEKQEALKEERRRIREENMSQVAPTGKAHRPPAFQKKTEQVFRTDDTPEAAKASQLRYEEAIPWHLEDFNGKNVYQGQYEAAMSECYLAFRHGGAEEQFQGPHFTVYPIEKFYRFREKNKFKHYSLEEAEEKMGKRYKETRWEMNKREAERQEAKRLEREGGLAQTMSLRRGERGELTKINAKPKREYIKREGITAGDEDDIDFNLEEEFADDEENALFEGENDEVKDAEDRIRKDQLGANAFDLLNEKDVDKEGEIEKKKKDQERALQKSIRKALTKRERRNDYESDSDENPYESKSESEDSETERRREEERKKEEEAKAAEKARNGDKPPSETSTRGTNTPSGRASKHPAPPMQKSESSSSLKRPGSPNASDLSGNESSRKKQKQSHLANSVATGADRMSVPGDRSRQPSIVMKNRLGGAGSGSDTDVSVSGRQLKKKRPALSPNGTPGASRAGSPGPGGEGRAGSPAETAARRLGPPPTAEEISAAIPPGGIALTELFKTFKGRINAERKEQFHTTIKVIGRVGKREGAVFIFPKATAANPSAGAASPAAGKPA